MRRHVACPRENDTYRATILQCCVVKLAASELYHNEGLAHALELCDQGELTARPRYVHAVYPFVLDGTVQTSCEDYCIGPFRSSYSSGEAARIVDSGYVRA